MSLPLIVVAATNLSWKVELKWFQLNSFVSIEMHFFSRTKHFNWSEFFQLNSAFKFDATVHFSERHFQVRIYRTWHYRATTLRCLRITAHHTFVYMITVRSFSRVPFLQYWISLTHQDRAKYSTHVIRSSRMILMVSLVDRINYHLIRMYDKQLNPIK